MKPIRILFLTHYFPPEGNAPATRVHEMSRQWVKDGHKVTVITGVPNVPDGVVYPGYSNRLYQEEAMDGIRVIRVWTYIAANEGTLLRIINYLTYMISAILAGIFVSRPDIVIATSPQFFCGWAGALLSKLRRLPFILEIRDIWPESIIAVGAISNSRIIKALEWLEKRMYWMADHIVTVGEGYRELLLAKAVDKSKISVIPNGIVKEDYVPGLPISDLRKRYNLNGEFVCAYIGTIGMAAGLDVVLEASRLLKSNGNNGIKFMMVGDGACRSSLEARAKAEDLDNVIFTGRQDKCLIPEFLASANACLVHLKKKDLFQSVLPSKIFEAAAMEKPIIMGVGGQACDIIRQSGAGINIEPENANALCEAVQHLASHPEVARQYGKQGRSYVLRHFDRKALSRDYVTRIKAVMEKKAIPSRRNDLRFSSKRKLDTQMKSLGRSDTGVLR
jgi:glycosyltransferase involved in cell wall biosynthesis